MDEPLGALDRRLRQSMQQEILRISKESGASVVYVTHDQEEALAMSDRIAVFREGRIEQIGAPREIYERPLTVFAAEFLGESNVLRGELLRADRISVNGVVLPCSSQLEGSPGAALVVRPERVQLGDSGPSSSLSDGDAVRLSGVVLTSTYLGAVARYVVSTPVGDVIVEAPPLVLRSPGDRVSVSWAVRDSTVCADSVA